MYNLLVQLSALLLFIAPVYGQTASDLIRLAAQDLVNGDTGILTPGSVAFLNEVSGNEVSKLRSLGSIQEIVAVTDQVSGGTWLATGRAVHEPGISDWRLTYSRESGKVVRVELSVILPGEEIPALPEVVYRGNVEAVRVSPSTLNPCGNHPRLCSPPPATNPNPRLVEFLFATTRASEALPHRVAFSGERATGITFGAARVRVPEDHRIGRIELPSRVRFLGFEIYQQKAKPDEHFIIKEVRAISQVDWDSIVNSADREEALVFVHGYNTSFDDALYRMAQIVWDLQYRKTAVLFSWASRGSTLNYVYDQQSGLIGSRYLSELLSTLTRKHGIKRIHVLAHSMGNLVTMEAMKGQMGIADPIRVAELIMAAPDVDRDYFNLHAPELRKLTSGMTLYASSNDKAITVSRTLAGGIPRAGDVPATGPVIVPGIDTIDVSVVGSDLLGLNHDVFASTRQVMNDIGLLLSSIPRKLPHQRLVEILGMPEGATSPQYWRYGR